MKRGIVFAGLAAIASLGVIARADVVNFNGPVVTSDTKAPGVWYTDRTAPGSFSSVTGPGGQPAIQLGINPAGPTPPDFGRFQGRHYDVGTSGPTQNVSVNFYLDPSWSANNTPVNAGFWASEYDSSGYNGNNPIIDYLNNDAADPHAGYTVPGFYTFTDAGTWGLLDATIAPGYHNLSITLNVGSGITLAIDGTNVGGSADAGDTSATSLHDVIYEATNFGAAQDYFFSDLNATSVVPLPSSAWAGLGLIGGMVAFGAAKRIRRQMA